MHTDTVLLGADPAEFHFNTFAADTGAPHTLADGALGARINGGSSVASGLTLTADSGSVTGLNKVEFDQDNGTLALADGDRVEIFLTAGTVDSVSVAGTKIALFTVSDGHLSTAVKADVNAEADAALSDYDGPTNAEMEARTLVSASYATATALQTVDDELAIVDGVVDSIKVVTDMLRFLTMYTGTVANTSASAPDLGSLGLADDELNECLIVFRDNSTSEYHARWITDFTGSSSVVALSANLPFTPESGVDTWTVFGVRRDGTLTGTVAGAITGDSLATSAVDKVSDGVWDEGLGGHTASGTSGQRLGRIPNAAPSGNGGLPTVDASNRIAGIAGTITTLDALDTAQDAQHTATQGLVTTVDGVADAIKAKTDSLSFNGSNVNSNIVEVNEVAVGGDGDEGTEWGPAS